MRRDDPVQPDLMIVSNENHRHSIARFVCTRARRLPHVPRRSHIASSKLQSRCREEASALRNPLTASFETVYGIEKDKQIPLK